MFFYFFEEYRETTYKGFRRKLEWNNIFIILVTIASAIPSFIALSKKHWIIASYLVALPFALIGGILIFADLRLKKNRSKMLSEYKKSHIKPLCTQLESFNLYNDAGIDWLIECCKEKKQKSKDLYPLSSMMHFVMNAISFNYFAYRISTK